MLKVNILPRLETVVETAGENAVQILRHTDCVCGSCNITTTLNVGHDISGDGEPYCVNQSCLSVRIREALFSSEKY